jgi:hypothetical protein
MSNETSWVTSASAGGFGGVLGGLVAFILTHLACRCRKSPSQPMEFDFEYNESGPPVSHPVSPVSFQSASVSPIPPAVPIQPDLRDNP